ASAAFSHQPHWQSLGATGHKHSISSGANSRMSQGQPPLVSPSASSGLPARQRSQSGAEVQNDCSSVDMEEVRTESLGDPSRVFAIFVQKHRYCILRCGKLEPPNAILVLAIRWRPNEAHYAALFGNSLEAPCQAASGIVWPNRRCEPQCQAAITWLFGIRWSPNAKGMHHWLLEFAGAPNAMPSRHPGCWEFAGAPMPSCILVVGNSLEPQMPSGILVVWEFAGAPMPTAFLGCLVIRWSPNAKRHPGCWEFAGARRCQAASWLLGIRWSPNAKQHPETSPRRCYDLIPTSNKLLVFDNSLNVRKAFFALVYNGLRAAPLWDASSRDLSAMLTISDFIHILQNYYRSALRRLLHDAVRLLLQARVAPPAVIDPATGNALFIVTHKRILKYIFLVLSLFVQKSGQRSASCVNGDGRLVDIYSKFDVIEPGRHKRLTINLDIYRQGRPLQCIRRADRFEGVSSCRGEDFAEERHREKLW
uniref:5'-AMP-activated protein kinase subunit gamma-2 n=1 Tax=Macrostomum lignano TaxID=282301 RepID=A0A1I8JS36_9PLAT